MRCNSRVMYPFCRPPTKIYIRACIHPSKNVAEWKLDGIYENRLTLPELQKLDVVDDADDLLPVAHPGRQRLHGPLAHGSVHVREPLPEVLAERPGRRQVVMLLGLGHG